MAQTASFREAAAVAFDSLRGSKLRSFLTLLGIILATTTLIAVMSVISGMDHYIAENVSSMGSDGFRIVRMAFIGNFNPKKFLEMQKKNPELSREEYTYLKEKSTLVRELGMRSGKSNLDASFGAQSATGVALNGVTANWAALVNTQLSSGRYLTDIEVNKHAPVAVIGSDIKDTLFPSVDPIGKVIRVDGVQYTVIGVAKAKGSVFGQTQDAFIDVPIGHFFQTYGSRTGISYAAQASTQEVLEQSQDEMRMLLRAYRHLGPKQEDTFSVISSDSLVSAWNNLTGAIAATAIAVVSVFMVVGGVVIMNIMLAAVTERTREIGIRKSVGARRFDILSQFLVESSMLAGVGGLMGVGLAWLVAVLVRNVTPVPMVVPVSSVILGVGLSSIVGLFFGIYPASRASKLDPIEALRAEA
jgi:putative ABC transport system permease protein